MHIAAVDIMPLDLPTASYRTAAGPITPRPVLVRVVSNDGAIGFGDVVAIAPELAESQESITAALVHYLAPALLGEDPRQLTRVLAKLDATLPGAPFAKSALDNALFDVVGRATGLPAYALLGGRIHADIPVQWSIGLKDTSAMVAEAKKYQSQGFNRFKIKIGPEHAIERDIANLKAIAAALDKGAIVGVDANQRYTKSGILAFLAELAPTRVAFLEQPLDARDVAGAASLQRSTSIPIMVDEGVFDLHQARVWLERRAAPVINVKVPKPGGLLRARSLAILAEAYFAEVHVGSTLETSLGAAASLHYYAATSNVAFGAAVLGPLHHKEDIVIDDHRLRPANGAIRLPDRPGLGVDVDEARVRRYVVEHHTIR